MIFQMKIFKISLKFKICLWKQNWPPHCSPVLPLGVLIWTSINSYFLRMLSHKWTFFRPVWFEKKRFFSIYSFVKLQPLPVAPSYWESWFKQILIFLTCNAYTQVLVGFFFCQLAFEKKSFGKYQQIFKHSSSSLFETRCGSSF